MKRRQTASATAAEPEQAAAPDAEEVHFEVDSHDGPGGAGEPEQGAEGQATPEPDMGLPVQSWTPEEASSFICALWNFGMLVWGPEWAAHPAETVGWNIYAAQLLDQVLPRGMGGAVELGAGLLMVGNGLATMAVRRMPLIERGPRPMWVQRPRATPEVPAPDVPAPPPPADGGRFHFNPDQVPQSNRDESLSGIGL